MTSLTTKFRNFLDFEYFIVGLPRSSTKFLSVLFSLAQNSRCVHEASVNNCQRVLSYEGNSDSGILAFIRPERLEGKKVIVINRNPEEVGASCERVGLDYAKVIKTICLPRLNDYINYGKERNDWLIVDYEKPWGEYTLRSMTRFLGLQLDFEDTTVKTIIGTLIEMSKIESNDESKQNLIQNLLECSQKK